MVIIIAAVFVITVIHFCCTAPLPVKQESSNGFQELSSIYLSGPIGAKVMTPSSPWRRIWLLSDRTLTTNADRDNDNKNELQQTSLIVVLMVAVTSFLDWLLPVFGLYHHLVTSPLHLFCIETILIIIQLLFVALKEKRTCPGCVNPSCFLHGQQ
jgi:hypothetical protein